MRNAPQATIGESRAAAPIFLKAGFGWGHMPLPMIEEALSAARLVKIRVEGASPSMRMPMHAVYRKDAPPGPAGRAFIRTLKGARDS